MMDNHANQPLRGTIWWVELPLEFGSHIQGGTRPCLVVSNNIGNTHSGVVTVCPLSTRLDTYPQHPKVNCNHKVAQVLCEQLMTLDVSQLGDYLWTLNELDMYVVNQSLLHQLALVD